MDLKNITNNLLLQIHTLERKDTLYPKESNKDDLEFLYKELFVKPQIFGQNEILLNLVVSCLPRK